VQAQKINHAEAYGPPLPRSRRKSQNKNQKSERQKIPALDQAMAPFAVKRDGSNL
jgi:hypothetical protein